MFPLQIPSVDDAVLVSGEEDSPGVGEGQRLDPHPLPGTPRALHGVKKDVRLVPEVEQLTGTVLASGPDSLTVREPLKTVLKMVSTYDIIITTQHFVTVTNRNRNPANLLFQTSRISPFKRPFQNGSPIDLLTI